MTNGLTQYISMEESTWHKIYVPIKLTVSFLVPFSLAAWGCLRCVMYLVVINLSDQMLKAPLLYQ